MPLLFEGCDFAPTDVELVTEPVQERRSSEVLAAYDAGGQDVPTGATGRIGRDGH